METRKGLIAEIGINKINKVLDIVDLFKLLYKNKNKNNKLKIAEYTTTYLNDNKIWKWEILLRSKKNNSLRNSIVIWGCKFPNLTEKEFYQIFKEEIKTLNHSFLNSRIQIKNLDYS